MSDNPMKLSASFAAEAPALEVKSVLEAARDWIFATNDEERYLGGYISQRGLDDGIRFDSYWVPNGTITVNCNTLTFELVGSPGDDLPGDIVLWLGKRGANQVKGSLLISATGDVIEIDHSF